MATAITSWIREVGIPMVPNIVIKDRVIDICRDFCQHTQLWNDQALTAIDIVDGTADYSLSTVLATAAGDLVVVEQVFVDGAEAHPTSTLDPTLPATWRTQTSPSPRQYMLGMDDSIKLVYTPSEDIAGGLQLYVALMPLETATTVEDFLWRDYWKVIRNGVRWQIFDLPAMPWSDPGMAEHYKGRYLTKRDSAGIKKITGRTNAEVYCEGGYFA